MMTTIKARRCAVSAALVMGAFVFPAKADNTFSLDFASNPVLPGASGQGLVYESGAYAESSVFQVANGLLILDTYHQATDSYADYQYTGGYDHTKDARISINLRVTNVTNNFGLAVGFADGHNTDFLIIRDTGWNLYPYTNSGGSPATGTFADQSAFHMLSLTSFAATNTYAIQVDGATVATGNNYPGAGSPQVYFGDSTTGGNVRAEIKSVSYANPAAVPEPSTAILLASGLALAAISALRTR